MDNTLSILTVEKQLPIFTTILENHQEINEYLMGVVKEYRSNYPQGLSTNVDAWRSSWHTHRITDKFQSIIDTILDACNFISRGYYHHDIVYEVKNMWAMMYDGGDSAFKHDHFPSTLSCVYYIDVDDDCSPIIFEGAVTVQPKNGMLIVFPSILMHEVPSTTGKRVAISMNIDAVDSPQPVHLAAQQGDNPAMITT